MRTRQSQVSQLVKSMVHGKPSRKQSQSEGIYDIFNWNEPNVEQKNSRQENNVKINLRQNNSNNEKQISQSYHQSIKLNNQFDEDKQNIQQNAVDNQYMVGKPKKTLRPHQVKQQLYTYQNYHLKRSQSVDDNRIQNQKNQLARKNKARILNENDENDKKQIEKRKQKIKQFKKTSRDLPNSAFVTYYGRPAFQTYGRCNSSANLKTHNVMPHKGDNQPKVKQTYQSALLKAQKVKAEDHLPRNPIDQPPSRNNPKQQSQLLHLPLQKPDLINHVRFSQPNPASDRKQPVPSYQQLKKTLRKPAKAHLGKKQKNKRREGQKHSKSSVEYEDGLKYMNNRELLVSLIEAKKTKDSRVAYKVTECYPPQAHVQLQKGRKHKATMITISHKGQQEFKSKKVTGQRLSSIADIDKTNINFYQLLYFLVTYYCISHQIATLT